jgi:hypothetical protein
MCSTTVGDSHVSMEEGALQKGEGTSAWYSVFIQNYRTFESLA